MMTTKSLQLKQGVSIDKVIAIAKMLIEAGADMDVCARNVFGELDENFKGSNTLGRAVDEINHFIKGGMLRTTF